MSGRSRLVATAAALTIVGAACTGSHPSPAPSSPPVQPPHVPTGGTLRAQLVSDVSAAFDPQKEYYPLTFELFRCCLLRTLLSTNGRDAAHGGTELHPDLAAAMPMVSTDGLIWMFHLKPGIRYAPPLQDLTVTSADFIRALEREACTDCSTGGYAFYYSVIEGFEAARSGGAKTIVGLSAPDPLTLRVRLNQPAGDLGWRFALAATAPIPPNPVNPTPPLGVAIGHTQDYGRFLATTGPYMFRWQSKLRYTANGKDENPVVGYRPGRSITLVRNPSWSASTDALRPAYVDEIDIAIGGTAEDVAESVTAGDLDLNLDSPLPVHHGGDATYPIPNDVFVNPTDGVRYLSLNLAMPPFDDIHVRKAVSYALDKDGMRRLAGGPLEGTIATHAIPDTLEMIGGRALLGGFEPYSTPNHAGDVAKALAEMKLSKYDTNGDGVCDAAACARVLTLTDGYDPYVVEDNFGPLGITLTYPRSRRGYFCNDPRAHLGLCLSEEWHKDYPDAHTWVPVLGSFGLYPSCCDTSRLGATREFLRRYHYVVSSVLSVDPDIAQCDPLTGEQRVRCWADLDRKVMTEVVPWVPYLFETQVTMTSIRSRNFTWDAFAGVASLDHLAIGSASPTG
jgi:ABC-type transport system substrate-binding protein